MTPRRLPLNILPSSYQIPPCSSAPEVSSLPSGEDKQSLLALYRSSDLSRYVLRTPTRLFDTITKRSFPLTTPRETLSQNNLLAGQERDAIAAHILALPEHLQLMIIPTWECNLRCSHCSVLHKLVREDLNTIDIPKFMGFIDRYINRYHPTAIRATYLGGEALLGASVCLNIRRDIIARGIQFDDSITTNLSLDLTPYRMQLLNEVGLIVVSIDGTEKQHNKQRHGYDNVYERTISNLIDLLKAGLRDKIKIQASLTETDGQSRKEFYRTLLKLGIESKNIVYACAHVTPRNPEPNQYYLKSLRSGRGRTKPCCEFRYMSHFIVDSTNRLYINYFEKGSPLGELDDELDRIERGYRDRVLDQMPILHDKVCMEKCDVVGYCWGGCTSSKPLTGYYPSEYCGRHELTRAIAGLADGDGL